MYKYIYWTYRALYLTSSMNLNEISLNWWYDSLFFNEWQFKDYEECNITKLDQPVPLERYTGKIPVINPETEQPTWEYKPKLTRFIRLKYSDLYTNPTDLKKSIENSWALLNIDIFTDIETARQRIRTNTNLQEVETWKFKLSDETTLLDWTIYPAQYLVID